MAAARVVVAVPEPVVEEKAAKRVNPIKLRQMQERLAAVEAEIPRVEHSLAETEQALGVYVSTEETQRLSDALNALREQQASLNSEWEELSMQLEEPKLSRLVAGRRESLGNGGRRGWD